MVPGTQAAITDWTISVDGTGASNNGAGLYSNTYLASQGFTGGDGNNAAWIDAFSNAVATTSTLTSNNIAAALPNTNYKVTVATGNYENIAGDVGITLLEGGVPSLTRQFTRVIRTSRKVTLATFRFLFRRRITSAGNFKWCSARPMTATSTDIR